MKTNFSDKELSMIGILSPHWYKTITESKCLYFNEPTFLKILGEECFIEGRTGPAVDSLRRCLKALSECDPYRTSNEYEDLILL